LHVTHTASCLLCALGWW